MILGTLETKPLQGQRPGEVEIEIGYYTVDVKLNEEFLKDNPLRMIKHTIAMYLASAVQDTQIPQAAWLFRSSPKLIGRYSFPETLDFEVNAHDLPGLTVQ